MKFDGRSFSLSTHVFVEGDGSYEDLLRSFHISESQGPFVAGKHGYSATLGLFDTQQPERISLSDLEHRSGRLPQLSAKVAYSGWPQRESASTLDIYVGKPLLNQKKLCAGNRFYGVDTVLAIHESAIKPRIRELQANQVLQLRNFVDSSSSIKRSIGRNRKAWLWRR